MRLGRRLAAIVALTRTLGIHSVAEGVETPEHLRLVRQAGCDLAQGWLLGQPMSAAQLPSWVSCIVRFIARILSRFYGIAYTN